MRDIVDEYFDAMAQAGEVMRDPTKSPDEVIVRLRAIAAAAVQARPKLGAHVAGLSRNTIEFLQLLESERSES